MGQKLYLIGSRDVDLSRLNVLMILVITLSLMACHEQSPDGTSTGSLSEPTSIVGYKTVMPKAAGYDAFEVNCITCHSLRYIQMQPDFPQKKWEGIVDKMIKTFGAPIPDSTAKIIAGYLTEVKGTK
jgi:sulfite dehydrogenase (cytochrome) subunit B